jgi:hypothetical protein
MDSTTTFDSTKESLLDLLKSIKEGKTQLPDFQRGWVWDDDHIRSLLASVSLSYPIGAVMMLQTGGSGVRFKPRPVEGVILDRPSFPERLILDGQQRLTSLFLSLYADRPVETRDVRGNTIRRWYYLDMKKILDPNGDREDAIVGLPESRQVLNFRGEVEADYSVAEREYLADLFPLSQLFGYSKWRSSYNKSWNYNEEKIRLFDQFEEEVIKRFEQYQIPLILLRKETPKDAVCQVFEKVNTGGVALTVFELLTATYASDDYNLRDDWTARQKRLHKQKVLASLENTDFLQAVTLLATYAYKMQNPEAAISCKRKDILRLTLEEYKNWAEPTTRGFEKAAKLLYGQKIFAARDLPYRTQLTPLAAILALLGDRADNDGVRTKLIRWYWCGVFGELYGGAIETRFAKDLPEVLNWIDGGPLPATIADANFAPLRLLTLQTRNSAAYKGIFALLLRHEGLDFRSGTPIDVQMYFDDKIDIHHIFPQNWCKQNGIDQRRCDSIVNKTALSSKTNRMIGGNAPSIYLTRNQRSAGIDDARMDQILRSHLIDPVSLRSDDFESFFKARQAALLGRIEEAMGKRIARDIAQEFTVGDLASAGDYQDEEED